METNPFYGLGFLMAVIAFIANYVLKRWEPDECYKEDERKYQNSCDKLYKALTGETPFAPESFQYLTNYLIAKLSLEGVSSWSSWGKSIRLFRFLRNVAFWFAVILAVLFSVYFFIYIYAEQSGITGLLAIRYLTIFFSILMLGILLCWGFATYRCNTVFAKRKDIFVPTGQWLRDNKVVPDYGLVLLSKLLTENKS